MTGSPLLFFCACCQGWSIIPSVSMERSGSIMTSAIFLCLHVERGAKSWEHSPLHAFAFLLSLCFSLFHSTLYWYLFKIHFFYSLCVFMGTGLVLRCLRIMILEIESLLLPWGYQHRTQVHETWWQEPLLAEPAPQHRVLFSYLTSTLAIITCDFYKKVSKIFFQESILKPRANCSVLMGKWNEYF